MNRLYLRLLLFIGSFLACHSSHSQQSIRLDDVTKTAGVDFKHFSGGTGKNYLVETVASGLATFDYDGDGLIDVYLLSGSPLLNAQVSPKPTCKLFRNLGGLRFEDVTETAHVGESEFALGVAAGDFDNDGDPDLFVSNFGPSVLLENCGDGTFVRHVLVPSSSPPQVGAGVSLLDVNSDGLLDAYFAHYVKFSFDRGANRTIFGVPAAPGPKDFEPDTHLLLQNDGASGFRDISVAAGIAPHAGPGMGSVAFDFDSDRDTDVFICNDSAANFLFENKGQENKRQENGGQSNFEEIAVLAGVAYDFTGAQQASMGVDVGDFNGDGLSDLVTTSFIDESPALYRNSGQGYFDDVAAANGLGVASRNVTWGVGFGDFDNDSWPDLFIASGHLIDGANRVNDSEKFAARNLVFRNSKGTRFVDVTKQVGSAADAIQVSRGIALDDLDNDGFVDIVVLNLNDKPQLIQNVSRVQNAASQANYLQLKLVGLNCNRDAVGSKVVLHVGDRTLVQEVIAGRGYQSHFGTRLSFGLGTSDNVDSIEVHWHAGQVQHFGPVKSNQQLCLIESHPKPIPVR